MIPAGANKQYVSGESVDLSLLFDATNTQVQGSVEFVRRQISAWNQTIGNLRLIARGIDPLLTSPVSLRDINIASDQKMGFFVIATVPFFLLMACFLGSVGFSADMLAGERERRSLESLLITPAQSSSLLMGKWLNTYSLTLIVIGVNLVLLFIAFQIIPFKEIGMKVNVDLVALLKVLCVLLPVAIFSTALQCLISLFARSFKDAQTYMGLMVFIPMVPLIYTLTNPSSYADWFMWIPVLSHQIVIKKLLLGELVTGVQFLQLWLVPSVLTAKQLRKPRVVYGF